MRNLINLEVKECTKVLNNSTGHIDIIPFSMVKIIKKYNKCVLIDLDGALKILNYDDIKKIIVK